ncbi:hypothetical protein EB796_012169 [Bugula neritina]|uniref:Sushi domain-containing protein n=1 Tax=Bugula neritina TaxID=10212 RepID=A0A7J7JSY4_BUGNE|nr:hypothetical protein EB796_012169 [Bugula neritina]
MADLKQDPNLIIATPSGGEPTEGSVISFSCDTSKFSLVGDREAVCTSEGEWDVKNAPQCLPLPTSTNSVTVSGEQLSAYNKSF